MCAERGRRCKLGGRHDPSHRPGVAELADADQVEGGAERFLALRVEDLHRHGRAACAAQGDV
eukprot:8828273-Heterocapsa_arctica.AAC.1